MTKRAGIRQKAGRVTNADGWWDECQRRRLAIETKTKRFVFTMKILLYAIITWQVVGLSVFVALGHFQP